MFWQNDPISFIFFDERTKGGGRGRRRRGELQTYRRVLKFTSLVTEGQSIFNEKSSPKDSFRA
jgi:hypothetical protein